MAALKDELDSVNSLTEAPSPGNQLSIHNQGLEAFKDVVYGSTAGVLGKFIEYPFDTVKVRLQSQSGLPGQSRLAGPVDAFLAAFRAPEGPLRSLYRGISAPLVGAAIETSSLFFSYRVAQDVLIAATPLLRKKKEEAEGKLQLPFQHLLFCGAVSGAFTSLALTPIELIKCKMQVPITPSHMASELGYVSTKSPGILQLISNIFRAHGLLGFWHGQLGTLIRETGGSAAWFGSYEGVKLLYLKYDKKVKNIEDVKVWQQMTAGALAGMGYNFAFYPADTIKSRMQTEEVGVSKSKGTFLSTGKELWRQAGLRGFYRGCGITVFRAAPSSAIIFSIYEGLRKYFG
jgi:mitochondrial ornithine carrier protein